MLVDDDSTDNFLHRRVLEKSGLVDSIIAYERAEAALEFLKTHQDCVDVICLDLNMPRMNGLEFLQEYAKLADDDVPQLPVMILSTSIGAEAEAIVVKFPNVVLTQAKPLTIDAVQSLADIVSPQHVAAVS